MFVYMLRCADGSLYTGITSDVIRRVKQHIGILKNGAKYTRSHPVVYIEAVWRCDSDTTARKTEYNLKKKSRLEKEYVICNPHCLSPEFEFINPKVMKSEERFRRNLNAELL